MESVEKKEGAGAASSRRKPGRNQEKTDWQKYQSVILIHGLLYLLSCNDGRSKFIKNRINGVYP